MSLGTIPISDNPGVPELLILGQGRGRSAVLRLVDTAGRRLYLSENERRAFLSAAKAYPPDVRSFCLTMLYTGCRISEALELTRDRVDIQAGTLVFRTLKRRHLVYRAVPVPGFLLEEIARVSAPGVDHVWPWVRRTGYRHIKRVMRDAGITGPQACPKGLRHGFGVACAERSIALNMVQKWLGHARLTTTAIYLNAVGEEERNMAARLWEDL